MSDLTLHGQNKEGFEDLNNIEKLWLATALLEEVMSQLDPEDLVEIRDELNSMVEESINLSISEKIEMVVSAIDSFSSAPGCEKPKIPLVSCCHEIIDNFESGVTQFKLLTEDCLDTYDTAEVFSLDADDQGEFEVAKLANNLSVLCFKEPVDERRIVRKAEEILHVWEN